MSEIFFPKRSVDTYRGYVTPKIDSKEQAKESDISKLPEVRMSTREDSTFCNVTVDEVISKPVSSWDDVQLGEGKNGSISVFPNPTTSVELFIDLSGFHQEQMDMLTIDPLVRIVNSKHIKAVLDDLEIISLKDFASGVYYLKFIGNDGVIEV